VWLGRVEPSRSQMLATDVFASSSKRAKLHFLNTWCYQL
jgi:hypothetical protein